MRKFYIFAKSQTLSDQLTWSHYIELLSITDINKINYYIMISEQQNLSVRELRNRIRCNEYERLEEETKNVLINDKKANITDFIKNPIVIKNNTNYSDISEKVLQKLILEDINNFLDELGYGFCYVKNEYKIKLGDRYNYIDLLLFNIKFNCYVVVELKISELKKEHIGQIQLYMNYIDENVKQINHNKTIGIIISKKNNEYVILYCSDKRIQFKEFMLN